ncbi:MAG: N-acetylmuramic acid 6-phosphate etherase [Planctomycetota bacterium]
MNVSWGDNMDRSSKHTHGTEARLSLERTLDQCSASEIVQIMNDEDARVHEAVAREQDSIAAAVEMTACAFSLGGRLIYMGAGTSGRLGMLDASECPPTFGASPEQVKALIAGGLPAFFRSIEKAEDDAGQAAADLAALRPPLCGNDVVIGITASGTTPYVLAGLDQARGSGARTVLLCCNPGTTAKADQVIALDTGPEVLSGSTRLKAGTATKMVLNMITTGAMALCGRIYQGLMVGMRPFNAKLLNRAVKMVATLTGKDTEQAEILLHEAGDRIDVAVVMARRSMDAARATALLEENRGDLRAVFEKEDAEENRDRP